MQIKGTVVQVHATEQKGNFTFRRLWLKIDETTQYPQTIELQASGQKVDILNNIQPGATITCDINLRGNEWNGKIFNTIQVWKVTSEVSTSANPHPAGGQDYNDNIPF